MGNFKTGFGKTKSQTANVTPSEIVFFDTVNPSTGGTVFDPNTPETTDTLYVSSVDASTWIWNGLAYVDYEAPTTDSTPFNLYATSIDAGGNKTAFISRTGPILINSSAGNGATYAGYFYSRTISGVGRGLIVKKDLRTTSGDYLTVQGANFSTGEHQYRLRVTHDGNLEINGAYTLPNVDGAVGQVPTTNGAGVVTWEDAGANSGIFGIADTNGVYTYYATLTLAMAGAVSGQTVEMFADVLETGSVTVALKNGVSVNGNGHTYTLNVNAVNDALTCGGATVELYNWKAVRTGRSNGASGSTLNCFNGGNVKASGVLMVNTYGDAVVDGGTIHGLHAEAYLDGFKAFFQDPKLYNCTGESKGTGNGIKATYTVDCTGIAVSGHGITGNGTHLNGTGISISGAGMAGQYFTDCTGISTSGIGVNASVEGRNCTGISVSGSGGAGNFYASFLRSTSGAGIGGGKLFNSYARSSGAIVAPASSIYNSTVESFWNNVGGHLTMTFSLGTREILNSTLIVTNASAYCITGYGGSTWNWANNSFKGATTPVNPTFIQGITNTSDSQGNILI